MTDLTASQRLRVWAASGVTVTLSPATCTMIADHLDQTQAAIDATTASVSKAMADMEKAQRTMSRLRWAAFAYMLIGLTFFIAA